MDKFYVELGTLLNTTPEDVKTLISSNDEAKALGLIESFKNSNKVYKNEEFETFVNNTKNDTKTEHVLEMQQLAKQGKLPRELHSVIKGSVLEQEQKRIAEQFGITDPVSSLDDVISKIAKSDGNTEKVLKELESLKTTHQSIVSDYEAKLLNEQSKVNSELTNISKLNLLNNLPLDVEEAKRENQITMLDAVVNQKYLIKWDAEKKRLVAFENEQIVKDTKTLEPVAVSELYKKVGNDFGIAFKQSISGRGDGSRVEDPNGLNKDAWIQERMKKNNGALTNADMIEFNKLFPKK